MMNESAEKPELIGLDFFIGADSFIRDLTEEDESIISGGRRSISTPSIDSSRSTKKRRRRRRDRSDRT
jgi:hypothetical protein